ncbi:hypothetical protein F441_22273 [Phytophthora nicotianae CJ01A1]|uniref:C2H2-type domain-containing protein n=2 Tax=Phytophthora nicotianae TaxID=4792 RepID=W2VPY0_PHYNI|nr:hypothetical protein L915_03327 [Phytophthora nicotianae]ETP00305.1 hypothetical protein F441_22273 [Phytophthora nicotianae CJ01A1]
MVRRSNKCPKCEKRFPIHRNMKHHQGKEYACGWVGRGQSVKQRKEVA